MAVPYGQRFPVEFETVFPQGGLMMGEVSAVTEYQSREDRAKGRPVRQQVDEETGKRMWRVTVSDPSATREADKSVSVTVLAEHQPVPPDGIEVAPGIVVRPIEFEGMTAAPKLEGQGEYKRLGYTLRATGMRTPAGQGAPAPRSSSRSSGASGASATPSSGQDPTDGKAA